jgi:hypothetical protein
MGPRKIWHLALSGCVLAAAAAGLAQQPAAPATSGTFDAVMDFDAVTSPLSLFTR